MKYQEIIKNLTTEQKVAIVSDPSALADVSLPAGLASVKFCELDRLTGKAAIRLPSYSSLGYAWNTDLAKMTFSMQAELARVEGVNVLSTSSAGVKSSPLSSGVSEDPCVSERLISAFEEGVRSRKMLPCIKAGIDKADIANMDKKKSVRAINDYFLYPYSHLKGSSISFPYVRYSGEYTEINTTYVNDFAKKQVGARGDFTFCYDCPPENAVEAISKGNILVGSSGNGVRSAVNKFTDLYKKVERGELDSAVLESALDDGTAMSMEQLDNAVDRVLELAEKIQPIQANATVFADLEKVTLESTIQSIVLMKNNGAVPFLMKRKKITIVGNEMQIDFMANMESAFVANKGYSATTRVGYKSNGEPSEELENFALSTVAGSDAVVVLLGKGEGNSLMLPANQLSLVDKLSKTNVPVVAVLCGDNVVDVGFDSHVNALLLCPSMTPVTPLALANILSGKSFPSGKLVNTFYDNTQDYFKNIHDYRNGGGMKVGVFLGYRYYETAHLRVKYPFGHGLSYTRFEYSNLSVQGNTVSFSIKNIGEMSGAEVAQVYLGKTGSNIVRPIKELKAFKKVFLKAGERQTVTLQIPMQQLAVISQGKPVIENGTWQVYVGSSVNSIKLRGAMQINGSAIKPDGEKIIDYVPDQSNILTGGYTVAPVRKKVKVGKKRKVFGCLTMGISVLLAIACMLTFAFGLLGETLDYYALIASYTACPVIFVIGLALLIAGIVCGKKAKKKAELISKGTAPQSQKPMRRQEYRMLFESLYTEDEEIESKKEEKSKVMTIANEEFIGDYRPDITFDTVCESLTKFLNESGIVADKAFSRKILASFSSSRFIVLSSNDVKLSGKLLDALAKFFGGGLYEHNVEECRLPADLIADKEGEETPIYSAINASKLSRDTINVVSMLANSIDDVSKLLAPFIKCSDHRNTVEAFIYQNGKTNRLSVYPNLWFVICADEGCDFITDNTVFCDAACALNLDITLGEEALIKTPFQPLNFYQFQKMEQKILGIDGNQIDIYSLDEEKYLKKFDRLEEYLSKRAGYEFSNKLNMSLERFIAVFIACNGESENAFDQVVAGKLILASLGLALDGLNEEGGLAERLDLVFGDGIAEETKRLISICSVSKIK